MFPEAAEPPASTLAGSVAWTCCHDPSCHIPSTTEDPLHSWAPELGNSTTGCLGVKPRSSKTLPAAFPKTLPAGFRIPPL